MPSDGFATAVERGYRERLILVAGWGFSGDVFASLELPADYLIVDDVGDFTSDPAGFVARLRDALDACGDRAAHVIGWSLGAHAAIAFARAFPERVESLHLVALRPSYPRDEIEAEKAALAAAPAEHLERFYRRVFLADDAVRAAFQPSRAATRALGPNAAGAPGVERLRAQLDFLADQAISPEMIDDLPAVFWHGKRDRIAPHAQAAELAAAAECELRVLERGGHAILFTTEFEDRWSEWLVARDGSEF